MGVAAAIAGSAVVGAYASNKASKNAAKATSKATDKSIAATSGATNQARNDLFKLFPAAQDNLAGGYQGALDVFGQSLPAQQQAFQGGNVAAQNQLLAGLPQVQNALLGAPVDYSQFQSYQAPTQSPEFFSQQLPGYVDPYAPKQSDYANQPAVNPWVTKGNHTGMNNTTNVNQGFSELLNGKYGQLFNRGYN